MLAPLEARPKTLSVAAEATRLCCLERKGAAEIGRRGAAAWERFVSFSPILTLSSAPKEVSLLPSAAMFSTACVVSAHRDDHLTVILASLSAARSLCANRAARAAPKASI